MIQRGKKEMTCDMKAESVKAERPSVRSAVTVMLVVVLLLGLVVQGCKMLEKISGSAKRSIFFGSEPLLISMV